MFKTTEEIYERYLKECKNHITWLKDCNSTLGKRILFHFNNSQLHNAKYIRALTIIETVLGLTEEEKKSHNLKDYIY